MTDIIVLSNVWPLVIILYMMSVSPVLQCFMELMRYLLYDCVPGFVWWCCM